MFKFVIDNYPYVPLTCVTLIISFIFGILRGRQPKFSFGWHLFWALPVPIIFYFHFKLSTNHFWLIPMGILFVLLEKIGQDYHYSSISDERQEKDDQIPEIREASRKQIELKDVMVILINKGGPSKNTKVIDVRRNYLSDTCAITMPVPGIIQYFISLFIASFGIEKLEKRYQLIGGGSLIYQSTQNQMIALYDELRRRVGSVDLNFAFNYSYPFAEQAMEKVIEAKKKYVLPLSLYPHYSRTTTGSMLQRMKAAAKDNYAEIIFLKPEPYYIHEGFVNAFVDRIHERIKPDEKLDDFYLIFTARGLRKSIMHEADPFIDQTQQTIASILLKLQRNDQWCLTFNKADGPIESLKPSLKAMLSALGRRNIKKVLVIPISFVNEDVETSCEIDIEGREHAESVGISDFRMTKALECHPQFIHALADTIIHTLNLENPNAEVADPNPPVDNDT